MGFADPLQPRPPAPHLQVNVPHPLEYPLVGPDHGVYVLCLAAGTALLEGLVGGRQWVSWWGGARRGPKERASTVLGGPWVLVQGGVLTSEPHQALSIWGLAFHCGKWGEACSWGWRAG